MKSTVNLANNLKTMRIKNQLSRKQVSDLVGKSISMIGLYESGERLPSLPILLKFATCYHCSIDYLLDNKVNTNDMLLSLEGLTPSQIKAIKLTVECFRNSSY